MMNIDAWREEVNKRVMNRQDLISRTYEDKNTKHEFRLIKVHAILYKTDPLISDYHAFVDITRTDKESSISEEIKNINLFLNLGLILRSLLRQIWNRENLIFIFDFLPAENF